MPNHKISTQECIEKFAKVHGELYDYSLVEYEKALVGVKIKCKTHGIFKQRPNDHLSGKGCNDCAIARNSKAKKAQYARTIINRFRETHGDKYDYSFVVYEGNKKKVTIICPEHGSFLQTPDNHLSGQGCIPCGYAKVGKVLRSSAQEWIKKAVGVHGDKYDYSLVEYLGGHAKVKIICKVHGEFTQEPSCHLAGDGCRKCSNDKHTGSGSPRWNPRLTDDERLNARNGYSLKLNAWRNKVYDRDLYTCQKCYEPSGKLNAHHILPWSKHLNERFEVDNGITLCRTCHSKYHSTYKLDKCDRVSMTAYLISGVVNKVSSCA